MIITDHLDVYKHKAFFPSFLSFILLLPSLLPPLPFFFFSEAESHTVAKAGLELTVYSKSLWN